MKLSFTAAFAVGSTVSVKTRKFDFVVVLTEFVFAGLTVNMVRNSGDSATAAAHSLGFAFFVTGQILQ